MNFTVAYMVKSKPLYLTISTKTYTLGMIFNLIQASMSATVKRKKTSNKKRDRELVLTVSLFLLSEEGLRKQFWNVKSVNYDKTNQKISVGINTTDGKLGTTLAKLRKVSKGLSNHLYDQGLTFRQARVSFFIDKEQEQIERIYQLLDKVSS